MTYTIKKLARLAGVSVRTLHYYDQIGLLKPSYKSENGYRHYEEIELLLLQQILFYRELEFPLEEIRKIISNPNFNLVEALNSQRRLLDKERDRLNKISKTIDKTIEKLKGERTMKDEELYEGLDTKKMKEYKKEAEERWGKDTVKRSYDIVRGWSKEKFEAIKQEGSQIMVELGKQLESGTKPKDPAVQALIDRHFHHIIQFYDPSWPLLKIYRGLGTMYAEDERFAAFYDKIKPGLAAYMKEAMQYYCDQQEAKS